jgi:hypothetical protein
MLLIKLLSLHPLVLVILGNALNNLILLSLCKQLLPAANNLIFKDVQISN